jgi:hypothetical protein
MAYSRHKVLKNGLMIERRQQFYIPRNKKTSSGVSKSKKKNENLFVNASLYPEPFLSCRRHDSRV